MERIKKALELADERRRSGVERNSSRGIDSVSVPGKSLEVRYTRTRRVTIDPKVFERNRLVTGDKADAVTTAYKMLRTHVLRLLNENHWNALAITSPRAHEGKTLTSINLAISIAREIEKTVLLVDLDLRKPSIHNYLEYTPDFDITDYLLRDVPLEDILINPGIDRLVVLPGSKPMSEASEYLSSSKMADLVEETKARYPSRIVLFDIPPILETEDALAFAPYVDASLLVLEEGKTLQEDIRAALDVLKVTNVLGTVLNKATGKGGGPYGRK